MTNSPADAAELVHVDALWRAANYLSVGQIYLYDNPLLKEPLERHHIKPRLLGHWGTTPGLNFVYAHLGRCIRKRDLNMIYITGPGTAAPGSSRTPISKAPTASCIRMFRWTKPACSDCFASSRFPGGIPSHVAAEVPGSIHEGGELGYSLEHAYGAAFDNPGLIAACVIGDGEAETGALATSWHSNKFLNPVRDGAVLPILHLNGYKIAGPTVLARIPREELTQLLRGLRLQAVLRGRPRARRHAPPDGGRSRRSVRRDRVDPARGAPAKVARRGRRGRSSCS